MVSPLHFMPFQQDKGPGRYPAEHSQSSLTRHLLDTEGIKTCVLFLVLKYSVSLKNILLL